jgi:hypothetical protein
MKLDTDPFPVGMVELELKKILVRTDQAKTTKGKNVIVSAKKVKPTLAMLIEKYQHQQEEDRRYRVARGIKRNRFFEVRNRLDRQETRRAWMSRRRRMQYTTDQAPGIR